MIVSIALATALAFQEPPQSKLPLPFLVGRDEWKSGNPLFGYAELLRMEKEYVADPMWKTTYFEARGTVAGFLGDTWSATRDWNTAYDRTWGSTGPVLSSKIDDSTPRSAIAVVTKAADKHRWIMVGEEHLKPQTRSLMLPLLRALRKKGFRYFAVEAFNPEIDQAVKTGYPTYESGYYTSDPVFGEGIREAIRLGYQLVPYEVREQPAEVPPNDPNFRQNFREHGQAANLKKAIFDKDPQAKVLVWAGRAHVLEEERDGWTPMAHEFKKLTGQDPFSVILTSGTEESAAKHEWPDYKVATYRGLVKQPTIFVDKAGESVKWTFDATVFFPRQVVVQGRPDWLIRELGRKPVTYPTSIVKKTGLQLVQAFYENEPLTAVPIDQALIRPGDPLPALMLPPKGKYWVRVIDAAGAESGRWKVSVER